jgi:hypothetical protein
MKLLTILFVILSGIAVSSPTPLHEPDGNCHRPYDEPTTEEDRCRHACDHELCACDKECEKTCKGDKECHAKCAFGPCLTKHGQCNQKCEE